MVVSFDQPWGEYIARQDQELTPLHFADTLVRGELGLAGVGLEIHYGYWPGGTLPRDPLEVSRQLDRWSQIGVPLMVFLSAPSGSGADPLARHPGRPLPDLAAGGVTPRLAAGRSSNGCCRCSSPSNRCRRSSGTTGKTTCPHEFATRGLLRRQGQAQAGPAIAGRACARTCWDDWCRGAGQAALAETYGLLRPL